nr:DJ-1/PfpI family protein [Planococcus halocryophilus]
MKILEEFESKGVNYEVVSETQSKLSGKDGKELEVDHTFTTTDPVLYDAIYAVGGPDVSKKFAKEASRYIGEAFDHYKPIGATHDGQKWLQTAGIKGQPGVVATEDASNFANLFIEAIAAHRHWGRTIE